MADIKQDLVKFLIDTQEEVVEGMLIIRTHNGVLCTWHGDKEKLLNDLPKP